MFYGKYNYVFYSFGLIWKLSCFRNKNISEGKGKTILLNNNSTSKSIQMSKFPDYSRVDIDEFMKVPFLGFIQRYVSSYRQAKSVYFSTENRDFLDAHPGMKPLLKFVFGPFLEYFRVCSVQKISNLPKSSVVLQTSDMSPHRHILVEICNAAGLETVVGQHGEISEPIVISRFISSRAILTSESTFDLYKRANDNKAVELLPRLAESDVAVYLKSEETRASSRDLYIMTCSFSGMSFDFNFSFNINMIKSVLEAIRSANCDFRVVIKLHPSESPELYRPHFTDVQFVSLPLSSCIDCISKAIVGPSTCLEELRANQVPVFYFGSGLQERVGFPKVESVGALVDFIRNS